MTQFNKLTASSSWQTVPSYNCRSFSILNNSGGTLLVRRVNETTTAEIPDGRSMNDILPQKDSKEIEVKSDTGTGVVSFTFDVIAG